MRQFASSGFKIWNLGVEAKLLYTFFSVFALGAYGVSVLYYEDLMGFSPGQAGLYYAGGSETRAAVAPAPGGPDIQLPAEAVQPRRDPVSYRHLLEVTHFHLFTVPVFLLIVAHLFMLTGLEKRAKLGWIGASGAAALVHLAAPWIVRYGGAGYGIVLAISGIAMLGTLGFMTVYATVMMWVGTAPADSSPP